MRYTLIVALLLLCYSQAQAEESAVAFKQRLQRHVDGVRYDHIVRQAANRGDQKDVVVWFRLGADGSLQNVTVRGGSISTELRDYIVRAFERLPKLRDVPGSAANRKFNVPLRLGG